MAFSEKDFKFKIYQTLKRAIKIKEDNSNLGEIIEECYRLFRPNPSKNKKDNISRRKLWICDNCGKEGTFQTGVNKKGEIATWCSDECSKTLIN
jgi:hypothetical protein